ncbi:hypothetical protein [Aliivibrio finisterrensis]|nr:hypothetical protein [Aliivibrio finisterrensis]
MNKKSLPDVEENIIDTLDVGDTYQEVLLKKKEGRNYSSKAILSER